jgi:hypothetical protein
VPARAGGDQALAGHGSGLQHALRGQRAGCCGLIEDVDETAVGRRRCGECDEQRRKAEQGSRPSGREIHECFSFSGRTT